MTRPSLPFQPNLVAFRDEEGRVVDFQETRFRLKCNSLHKELWPLAQELSSVLGVAPMNRQQLASLDPEVLGSGAQSAWDVLDMKINGLRRTWIPLALFLKGERVLSLHATYSPAGAYLDGLTIRDGVSDLYTECSSISSALKVGRSYLSSLGVE